MELPEVVAVGGLPEWALAGLRIRYRVHDLGAAPDRRALLAGAARATVAVTVGTVGIDAETVRALPALGLVATLGLGYDRVDVTALRERGVRLANTPGVVETCVADHAIGLLISLVRRIAQADRLARAGVWAKREIGLATRVSGQRLGILGLGGIGARIARRAVAFDMPIGYHNRRPRPELPYRYFGSTVELAQWSDCLVVACPGGAQTRHLVDAAVLAALGPQGVLVNVARGSVVDEAALAAALAGARIGGAALDVFENEPGFPAELLGYDNVVLTPHIGGSTRETWRDAFDLVLANVEAFLAGREPVTPVGL
jgi:lactate dehydrogenase-like 2-hydroxyacid dehydrogenase